MHPIESSERPSPAIAAPASSPAPADAGQGVGTGFESYLSRKREALRVLKEMFQREKSGSPEYEALLDAIASLTMILEDAGRA